MMMGETSSGKSECTREMLSNEASLTILDSFGNVGTSSKCGKFLDVSMITTYLLEVGRVSRCDRNFNIFYQLLLGASV